MRKNTSVIVYDVPYIEKRKDGQITLCNGKDILRFKRNGEFSYNGFKLEVDRDLYKAFKTFLKI